MLGWTFVYAPLASHLRSPRKAPCLSRGRLPPLANASELRDVEIQCKGNPRHMARCLAASRERTGSECLATGPGGKPVVAGGAFAPASSRSRALSARIPTSDPHQRTAFWEFTASSRLGPDPGGEGEGERGFLTLFSR
jgi:hypothetical protein